MGSADIILDLVSTGVTLRENNLKQIEVLGLFGTVVTECVGTSGGRRAAGEQPQADRGACLNVLHFGSWNAR